MVVERDRVDGWLASDSDSDSDVSVCDAGQNNSRLWREHVAWKRSSTAVPLPQLHEQFRKAQGRIDTVLFAVLQSI